MKDERVLQSYAITQDEVHYVTLPFHSKFSRFLQARFEHNALAYIDDFIHDVILSPPAALATLCGKPAFCRSSRLCATHPFPTSRSPARSLSWMIYAARISGAKLVKKSQTIQLSCLFCNINYHFSRILCQKSKD